MIYQKKINIKFFGRRGVVVPFSMTPMMCAYKECVYLLEYKVNFIVSDNIRLNNGNCEHLVDLNCAETCINTNTSYKNTKSYSIKSSQKKNNKKISCR